LEGVRLEDFWEIKGSRKPEAGDKVDKEKMSNTGKLGKEHTCCTFNTAHFKDFTPYIRAYEMLLKHIKQEVSGSDLNFLKIAQTILWK
jgi:hypothetical protein